HCLKIGLPMIPGICTPSEVEAALELGLRTVKFFPAEPAGGVRYLKAIAAPYADVEFMPTGGITRDSLGDYLSFRRVVACGGSWAASRRIRPRRLGDGDRQSRVVRLAVAPGRYEVAARKRHHTGDQRFGGHGHTGRRTPCARSGAHRVGGFQSSCSALALGE